MISPLSPYLSPACCCTASSRCSPASSKTPTGTGSTGRQQSPTPGSSRLPHPGRAPGRRTPARPASAASAESCAPTPPSRWQQRTWRGWRDEEGCCRCVLSSRCVDVCRSWGCAALMLLLPTLLLVAPQPLGVRVRRTLRLWAPLQPRTGDLHRLQSWRQSSEGSAGATGS